MPLYEYQCHACGNRFERIEKASALHDTECPGCGGAARRLIGAPALKFKGSGWYVNDYGKGNGSKPSAAEAPSGSTTETSNAPPAATEKDSSTKTPASSPSKVA